MSRVVIIGGSGHVGTYLVPRLVEAGFDVVNVSRGERQPYQPARRLEGGRDCRRSTATPATKQALSRPRSAI